MSTLGAVRSWFAKRGRRGREKDSEEQAVATRAEELQQLWLDYRRTGDPLLRDRLVLTYTPFVKFLAGRLSYGLAAGFAEGDLVSYGLRGLTEAIEQYEPARDGKFDAYAMARITRQMSHELRSRDWRPDHPDEPEAEGGGGVREPRRPILPDLSGLVELPLPELDWESPGA